MTIQTSRAGFVRRMGALVMSALLSVTAFLPAAVHAQVNIANSPLFVAPAIDPNIMFILDDSGSMFFEVTPDDLAMPPFPYAAYVFPRANNVYGANDYTQAQLQVTTVVDGDAYNAITRSPQHNSTYYNPAITYTPWVRHDGTLYPPASPSCAWHNPENTGTCPTGTSSVNGVARNLTVTNARYNNNRWRSCTSAGACTESTDELNFWPATYFWHDGGDAWDWDNYTQVQIQGATPSYTGHGREARTDCVGGTCTGAQELQNFANWYTYYRSRILASRAGIGRAFSQLGDNVRVGYGSINKGSSSVDNVDTTTIIRGVRTFAGDDREAFYRELYTRDIPNLGTPLRRALNDAGQYYSRSDARGPWSSTPGSSGGEDLECRQSFTILMTDGYWSGGSANQAGTSAARQNVDGSAGPTITGPDGASFHYDAGDPFADSVGNTLADVAMYYWKQDLNPDLVNRVPTTSRNPAFWQHMVTYGVALGLQGSIDPEEAWEALASGSPIAWPDPHADQDANGNCQGESCAARLDDLLHAAVNARGGFFSAADPDTFAQELANVLDDIITQVEASATSAAASTAVLQSDSLIYLAGFRSDDWSGELKAFDLLQNGAVGPLKWDAEDRLRSNAISGRNIYTSTNPGGAPVSLSYDSLSDAQQDALDTAVGGVMDERGADRVSWLRGAEVSGLRSRTPTAGSDSGNVRRLGDIVGSSPRFVGRTNFGYSWIDGTEGTRYTTFRSLSTYQNRPDMLYVGANDGMVHGFDAQTGNELFAYMPSELLMPESPAAHARINRLMDPDYGHRYFMDGNLTIIDAYWGGSWKTVLLGTMGAGGRTVFALDVTNPGSFGAGNVLWEFTHEDLGYGVSDPAIVRLPGSGSGGGGQWGGRWAAVFGNGYNGENHQAKLFVVPLDDPSDYEVISTGAGTSEEPNGLGPATATAWPSGGVNVSHVYAGDLHGNIWRFKLTGNPSWSAEKLFEATDPDGEPQPITSRPRTVPHPEDADRLVVLFGTGSYFRDEDNDVMDPQIQTLYGVFDSAATSTNLDRDDLLAQEIVWQGEQTFTTGGGTMTYAVRHVSDNQLSASDRGWYMDLVYGSPEGERVISPATFPSGFVGDRVRFTTLIPDPDPCGPGRAGFIMDISLTSGGVYPNSVFDLNQDGIIDADDAGGPGDKPISGAGSGSGEMPIVVQSTDGETEIIIFGDLKKAESGAGGSVCVDDDCPPCQGDNCPLTGLTADSSGRQFWRQVR